MIIASDPEMERRLSNWGAVYGHMGELPRGPDSSLQKVIDELRLQRGIPEGEAASGTRVQVSDRLDADTVGAALLKLRAAQRRLLVLRYGHVKGLDDRWLARRTGVPLSLLPERFEAAVFRLHLVLDTEPNCGTMRV